MGFKSVRIKRPIYIISVPSYKILLIDYIIVHLYDDSDLWMLSLQLFTQVWFSHIGIDSYHRGMIVFRQLRCEAIITLVELKWVIVISKPCSHRLLGREAVLTYAPAWKFILTETFMEGEENKAKVFQVRKNTLKQDHRRIQKIAEESVVKNIMSWGCFSHATKETNTREALHEL